MSVNSNPKHTENHSHLLKCKVLSVSELAPEIFRIRFINEKLAVHTLPGQFINIKVTESDYPLWRRPFSIHNVSNEENWVEILFRVVGKGTHILSQYSPGQYLDILGPLGNHFVINTIYERSGIMVAGGLGIAPFLFLSKKLLGNQITPILFYGVKTASEFCCLNELSELGVDVHLCTEDGSKGFKGYVTDLVAQFLEANSTTSHTTIYSCGPNPMMNSLGRIAEKHKLKCQVSLETLMACGVGACLGCGVKARKNPPAYRYVCKEGPVFNINEIDLSD